MNLCQNFSVSEAIEILATQSKGIENDLRSLTTAYNAKLISNEDYIRILNNLSKKSISLRLAIDVLSDSRLVEIKANENCKRSDD
jgi:hypothetical protein